jgi:hypothetical protein
MNDDKKWIEYVGLKINDSDISSVEKSYYERILRIYNMEDLSKQE